MKVASRLAKDFATQHNSSGKLSQNVKDILSKMTEKTRIGKTKSQQSIASKNFSHIRLKSLEKHNTPTKPEPEKHSSVSLEQDNNFKRKLNHSEIMSTLAATLKKREIQISKSIDKLFESSIAINTEILSVYLEKEVNIINKIAYEYKNRMDEHTDERLNWLRKLQLGLDKYQMTASTLLENLEKNHSQNLRTRKDFMEDMERIHSIHQSEITKLYEEIDKSTEHFHKVMSISDGMTIELLDELDVKFYGGEFDKGFDQDMLTTGD
ncbi:22519_t:CDS:2 [Rhizophagus irregularis]|nr:22519_t:CDS:2 [Rhizophagus irregularis]